MPARSVCLVTLSPSEAGPGRFGRQASVTDIYHAMPCHAMPHHAISVESITLAMGVRHRHLPCHAMPCHAMPCHTIPCHAVQFSVCLVTLSLSEAGPVTPARLTRLPRQS